MLATNFSRRAPIQRLMNTGTVVILWESAEYFFQVLRVLVVNKGRPWSRLLQMLKRSKLFSSTLAE